MLKLSKEMKLFCYNDIPYRTYKILGLLKNDKTEIIPAAGIEHPFIGSQINHFIHGTISNDSYNPT